MNEVDTNVLEEIKDLIIEGEYHARDTLIKTYYKAGQLILKNNLNPQQVAKYIGRSERMVEYMVKFAQQPKILDSLDKKDTWTSIIRNRLTDPNNKMECEHLEITICKKCRIELKLQT